MCSSSCLPSKGQTNRNAFAPPDRIPKLSPKNEQPQWERLPVNSLELRQDRSAKIVANQISLALEENSGDARIALNYMCWCVLSKSANCLSRWSIVIPAAEQGTTEKPRNHAQPLTQLPKVIQFGSKGRACVESSSTGSQMPQTIATCHRYHAAGESGSTGKLY